MIETSDAEKIEKDYLETLENLIKIIHESAKKRGIKSSNEISIAVDNENVYRGRVDDNNFNKINPFINENLVDKLNQAIFEPQNLKGKVSIKIGEEEVFHVEDGVVVKDKLGLSQPLSQTQENESQKNKPIVERTYSVEQLQKQVNVLQKKVQEQQELVESLKSGQLSEESIAQLAQQIGELFKSLEKQQKLIEKTQQSLAKVDRSLPPIKNTKLQNFVGGIENGVKQIVQGLFKSLKDSVMSRVNHTKQQMNGMKTQVKSKVDNWRYKIHEWSETAKGKAIAKSVKELLRILGKSNPDGSVSFESSSFYFEQQGENIIVRAKNGEPVLHNGALSPNISRQQSEALDKVYSVVSISHQLEIDKTRKGVMRFC
ncbi:hypothetical protein [Anabaena sp. UHCC 0399]|uniref:hypothetical protein n=1 Tax=Anabaena sp. UHCC 0399 TaxID=3110238 RepID=UPI002B1F036F|nr:hypothetical protein [Anabaena sp. UHCC 0399]MEA5566644.1 hypothetical protein [Anabaena sp. UHCC 0399]